MLEEMKEFVPIAERMAEHIHEKGFSCVVVGGRSGQIAAYMVKQAWQRKYGRKPMPKFVAVGRIWNETKNFSAEQVAKEIRKNFSVGKMPKDNAFILCDYAGTGNSVVRMKNVMRLLGFGKIGAGAFVSGKSFPAEKGKEFGFIGKSGGSVPAFNGRRKQYISNILKHREVRGEIKKLKASGRKISGEESASFKGFEAVGKKAFRHLRGMHKRMRLP